MQDTDKPQNQKSRRLPGLFNEVNTPGRQLKLGQRGNLASMMQSYMDWRLFIQGGENVFSGLGLKSG